MHRKRLLCWKAYLPRSSWPTQPTTPIICARPSLPKARSPSSPTTRHGRSNIRSTSISMPSAISWSAASQNSNNSAASQPASKRQPEITLPSSLSQPSSYGYDKCPHHLALRLDLLRGLRRKIGQDAVGAGALEGEQALHHRAFAVDPAIGAGGCNHRVFAGHLVDEGRHRKGVLYPPHDVEIGHARLHHHHVRALGDVEL